MQQICLGCYVQMTFDGSSPREERGGEQTDMCCSIQLREDQSILRYVKENKKKKVLNREENKEYRMVVAKIWREN